MRIAILIPAIDKKGPTIFLDYLIKGFINNKQDIVVYYFDGVPEFDLGVETRIFTGKESLNIYDVVLTIGAKPAMCAAKRVDSSRWVAEMVNLIDKDFRMLYGPLEAKIKTIVFKKALKKCKYFIVSSNSMRSYYEEFIPGKNYEVIPHGILNHEYGEIEKEDRDILEGFKKSDLTVIGTVGGMIKRKGFEQLMPILKKNEELALCIIGDGEERDYLEQLCKELKIEERVFMPGFRNNSYNYYKYFDIYCHVSYSEGFGMAFLEAMAKRLPVICSRLDIYEDYFTDNDVAYFTPGDTNSLNEAVKRIMRERDAFIASAQKVYQEQFDLDVMAKSHIEYFRTIV